LWRVFFVALVVERHWLERQDVFTAFFHRFNPFLESARRTYRAKLAVGVYDDIYSVGRHASITDDDVAAAGGDVKAGHIAERGVAATSRIVKSGITDGSISAAVTVRPRANAPTAVFAPLVLAPAVVLLESAEYPTAVFWTPVMFLNRASVPLAVFSLPVVLLKSAAVPKAVFSSAVLKRSAPAPVAVLKLPSVLLKSEYQPIAVLPAPVVRLKRAFCPFAVLNPG
jgi:hypothetical protein